MLNETCLADPDWNPLITGTDGLDFGSRKPGVVYT